MRATTRTFAALSTAHGWWSGAPTRGGSRSAPRSECPSPTHRFPTRTARRRFAIARACATAEGGLRLQAGVRCPEGERGGGKRGGAERRGDEREGMSGVAGVGVCDQGEIERAERGDCRAAGDLQRRREDAADVGGIGGRGCI